MFFLLQQLYGWGIEPLAFREKLTLSLSSFWPKRTYMFQFQVVKKFKIISYHMKDASKLI